MGTALLQRGLAVGTALLLCSVASAGTSLEPQLSLLAEQRYDDDLRDANEQVTSVLQSKISPKLGFSLLGPQTNGQVWYATDIRTRYNSGFTEVDHRAQLANKFHFSEISAVDFDVRFWRVTDPTSLPRMGMPRVRDPIRYGTAQLGGVTQFSRRLSGRVQYRFEGAQIETAGASVGAVHTPSAEAWYKLSPRNDAGVEYRFQYFTYGAEQSLANGAFLAYRFRFDEQTQFQVRGGPILFQRFGEPASWTGRGMAELTRQIEMLELGVSAGHDLVGASGFLPAVWADYATLTFGYRFLRPMRIYGAASYFRNGRAPHENFMTFVGTSTSEGYAFGGGLEWTAANPLVFQMSFDRIAQVGAATAGPGVDFTRNIAAVRMVLTAF